MVLDNYEHHVEEDCEDDDSTGDGEHARERDAFFTLHIQEESLHWARSVMDPPHAPLLQHEVSEQIRQACR